MEKKFDKILQISVTFLAKHGSKKGRKIYLLKMMLASSRNIMIRRDYDCIIYWTSNFRARFLLMGVGNIVSEYGSYILRYHEWSKSDRCIKFLQLFFWNCSFEAMVIFCLSFKLVLLMKCEVRSTPNISIHRKQWQIYIFAK